MSNFYEDPVSFNGVVCNTGIFDYTSAKLAVYSGCWNKHVIKHWTQLDKYKYKLSTGKIQPT